MSFILDNLTAILVAAVLLGALLVFQQRGQQDAVEAVQRNRAHLMASELAHTLEREIENGRGRDETERMFSTDVGGPPLSPDEYRYRLLRGTASDGTEYTRHLSFPTLLAPDDLGGSPLAIVSYAVEETGETTFIDGRDRPLLRARRFVFPRSGPIRETGVYERLVDFDVTVFNAEGTEVLSSLELADTPPRVHIELVVAPRLVEQRAGDQRSGAAISTRHARTIRVPASTAYEGAAAVPTDVLVGAGGIPPLPGDDDYEPASGSGDDASSSGGDDETPPSGRGTSLDST